MSDIITNYKERGIIHPKSYHVYKKDEMHNLRDIQRENSISTMTKVKCITAAVIAIGLWIYNPWFKFISITILGFLGLGCLLASIFGGMSLTSGGSNDHKIMNLQDWFGYVIQDEFSCYSTGGHDYGEIIIELSKKDFDNIVNNIDKLPSKFVADNSNPSHTKFTYLAVQNIQGTEYPQFSDTIELDYPTSSIRYCVTFF